MPLLIDYQLAQPVRTGRTDEDGYQGGSGDRYDHKSQGEFPVEGF